MPPGNKWMEASVWPMQNANLNQNQSGWISMMGSSSGQLMGRSMEWPGTSKMGGSDCANIWILPWLDSQEEYNIIQYLLMFLRV